MKEIIKVTIKTRKVDLSTCKTELLVVGMFSDGKVLDKNISQLDKKLNGAIKQLTELGDFKGKDGTTAVVYGKENIGAKRVLLVGLGEKKKIKTDTIRKAAALAANKAVLLKAKTVSLALHVSLSGKFDTGKIGQAIAEGVYVGSYRYDEFITNSNDDRLKGVNVEVIDFDSRRLRMLTRGVEVGDIVGQAQTFARTIANRPGNVINPAALAKTAMEMAKQIKGLSCTILDEKQLKQQKMGGILAVGSGSKNPPRLIILKYTPANSNAKIPTIGLVGKAITFDSGGISIKPSAGMQDMKFDKSGGLAVLGTMKAVAQLKPKVTIYGIIPSAENLPSGTSYRPGDIVTTFSGKTVEVQNTDAEGRMILCDGIHYAVTQKCDAIIDIATLTGACMVALGQYKAGLMSNDNGLLKLLQKASEESGEKVWHLPCGDEYTEEMKSKIADLKNIGGKWGGACTAASFLKEFVDETKWAHIDMAGVDVFGNDSKPGGPGATGFGVRLLTTYLLNAAKKK